MTEFFWAFINPLRFFVNSVTSAVYFRFTLDEENSDIAFWRELNLGWYEMQGDTWSPFAHLLTNGGDV